MRMWGVNTKVMCRQHLLGEHLEMHMFLGALNGRSNIHGHINNQLIEVHNIKKRHDKLVKEMKRRGYNHKSVMVLNKKLVTVGFIDVKTNLKELKQRCKKCGVVQE